MEGSLLHRFWREIVRPYRGRLFLAFALMLGIAAAEGAFVLTTRWIFSGLAPDPEDLSPPPLDTVVFLGPIFILMFGIAQAGFFYSQAVTAQSIAVSCLRDLQVKMFGAISRLDLAQTQGDGSGQLISRFTNDTTILREGLTRGPNGVRDVVRLLVAIGVLAFIDWVLLLAVLLIYPTVGVPITWLGARIRRLGRRVQAQIGDVTGLLGESLEGRTMVKSYVLEGSEEERLGAAFEERRSLLTRLLRIRAANEPIVTIVGAVAIAAIIGLAALRIRDGAMTGADAVAFLVGMALLSAPARGLGTLNAVVQESLSALERMFDIFDRTPTIVDRLGAKELPPLTSPPAVAVQNIGFAYRDGEPVLDGVSFTAEAGQTVALVGPSGAGKSSLFGLIPRLYEQQTGAVTIAGHDTLDLTLSSLRGAVGLVSQDPILFNVSVAQNIAFGRPGATRQEIEDAARRASAHEFITELPQGYDTPVGERGGELSGGQRQRLSLARAFLKDAPLLLLDEATASLDAKSEREIEEALERLKDGRTTLIIAHRLSTIQSADKIIVLERGKVVEEGTHQFLLDQGGLYATLSALQFRRDEAVDA